MYIKIGLGIFTSFKTCSALIFELKNVCLKSQIFCTILPGFWLLSFKFFCYSETHWTLPYTYTQPFSHPANPQIALSFYLFRIYKGLRNKRGWAAWESLSTVFSLWPLTSDGLHRHRRGTAAFNWHMHNTWVIIYPHWVNSDFPVMYVTCSPHSWCKQSEPFSITS